MTRRLERLLESSFARPAAQSPRFVCCPDDALHRGETMADLGYAPCCLRCDCWWSCGVLLMRGVSARVRSSFPARVRSATLLTADVAVAVLRALAVGAWWVSGAGPQRSSPTRAATGHTGWLHQRRQLHQRRRLRRQRRRLRWRLRRDSRAAGTQRRSRRRGTNQRGSLGGRKARPRPSYFDHQYAFV